MTDRSPSLVLLFAGQGSQVVGMGSALRSSSEVARSLFAAADAALDLPLTRIMATGPEADLRRTEIAQPALLTLAVAHARILLEKGFSPSALAGHSLGQYPALVVAGALPFEEACRLVAARGRLMQETVPEGEGAMSALIGLDRARIYEICAQHDDPDLVNVACHNAPGQTVISGSLAAVAAVEELCEKEGAGVISLPVTAPFHCRLLEPMVSRFADLVAAVTVKSPELPVIDNVTAQPLGDAEMVRKSLVDQVLAPVLFEESLCTLAENGARHFIQCGPGKSLLGFARRSVPGATVQTFEAAAASRADEKDE